MILIYILVGLIAFFVVAMLCCYLYIAGVFIYGAFAKMLDKEKE